VHPLLVQVDGYGVDLDMLFFQYLDIIFIDLIPHIIINIQQDQPNQHFIIIIVHGIIKTLQEKLNAVLQMVKDIVVKMKKLNKVIVVVV
jgi:hypothetical protein